MFTSIKTSKENKEVVTQLTKRLQLGTENVIARLAFSYSLASNRKLDLSQISDAQGKEYTSKILFGEYIDVYIAMTCIQYGLYKTDKDLSKYMKMHIDDGLQLIKDELKKNDSITGTDFIINKVEKGLKQLS